MGRSADTDRQQRQGGGSEDASHYNILVVFVQYCMVKDVGL